MGSPARKQISESHGRIGAIVHMGVYDLHKTPLPLSKAQHAFAAGNLHGADSNAPQLAQKWECSSGSPTPLSQYWTRAPSAPPPKGRPRTTTQATPPVRSPAPVVSTTLRGGTAGIRCLPCAPCPAPWVTMTACGCCGQKVLPILLNLTQHLELRFIDDHNILAGETSGPRAAVPNAVGRSPRQTA